MILLSIFIACGSEQALEGEFYINNSNTIVKFENKRLFVEENSQKIYDAHLTDVDDNLYMYTINNIYVDGIRDLYKREDLKIGNQIYITVNPLKEDDEEDKSSYITKIEKDKVKIPIIGNFFGKAYNYELSLKTTYHNIETAYLKEVEIKQFDANKYKKLNENYLFKINDKYDKSTKKNTNFLFDNDDNTLSAIDLDIINQVGIEILLEKIKNDNLDEEINIIAVEFKISKSKFYDYYRPAQVKILFSDSDKENIAYKKYIYTKELHLQLKDQHGRQLFYLMEPVKNPTALYISSNDFYEGLDKKLLISDIIFYIDK